MGLNENNEHFPLPSKEFTKWVQGTIKSMYVIEILKDSLEKFLQNKIVAQHGVLVLLEGDR